MLGTMNTHSLAQGCSLFSRLFASASNLKISSWGEMSLTSFASENVLSAVPAAMKIDVESRSERSSASPPVAR